MVFHQGSSDGFPLWASMILLWLYLPTHRGTQMSQTCGSPVISDEVATNLCKKMLENRISSLVRLGIRSARGRLLLQEVISKLPCKNSLQHTWGVTKTESITFFTAFMQQLWSQMVKPLARAGVQSPSLFHCQSNLQTHLDPAKFLLNNSNFIPTLLPSLYTTGTVKKSGGTNSQLLLTWKKFELKLRQNTVRAISNSLVFFSLFIFHIANQSIA